MVQRKRHGQPQRSYPLNSKTRIKSQKTCIILIVLCLICIKDKFSIRFELGYIEVNQEQQKTKCPKVAISKVKILII